MILNDTPSYYDLLELSPDASTQEIRAAYLRAKSAYNKDSVALYSLISAEETHSLLNQIEEAYNTLSTPEKRREYDRKYAQLTLEDEQLTQSGLVRAKTKVVSIDRVPPMEDSSLSEENLLISPSTDFEATVASVMGAPPPPPIHSGDPLLPPPGIPQAHPQPAAQTKVFSTGVRHSSNPITDTALAKEIEAEIEWHGTTIRRYRELRRVAIEEVAEFTKISKNYLFAIEEENYEKLPAAVYLRGFLTQLCKFLRLPPEQLIPPYMARHKLWIDNNGRHR